MTQNNILNTPPNHHSRKTIFSIETSSGKQLKKIVKLFLLLVLLSLSFSSCKKLVEIDTPKTQITSKAVFSNEATATSAVAGLYYQLSTDGFACGGGVSFTVLGGLSSDEFMNYSTSGDKATFFTNSLKPQNTTLSSSLWASMYKTIYSANAIIEGLEGSSGLTPSTISQLEGEAKFVRGFCYFYLTNLFGDVPLVINTDYKVNNAISRTSKSKVLDQVIKDLLDAQQNLAATYVPNTQRSRPNKSAATALLARTYLYLQQWQRAQEQASAIISDPAYVLSTDLNTVFLASSQEAIWQLKPSTQGLSTLSGNTFILTSPPTNVVLSNLLYSAFDSLDKRKQAWIGVFKSGGNTFYYPYKYKEQSAPSNNPQESSVVIRLAEIYLIRAEAKANLNDLDGAVNDINVIRSRAGLPGISSSSKDQLLLAIENERRLELFSEWGHRWLDLVRTNRASDVLAAIKSPNWQSTDVLYPIPQNQIDIDPNITQNPGY